MASLTTDDNNDVQQAVYDLSDQTVVTKYKMASEIVQKTLEGVISQCVADKKVSEICAFGNLVVEAQCKNIFKGKKIEKGLAFPTCVSVNECVCHNSPIPEESGTLKDGDVVKIDIGAHVDGYIAVVAHTHIVGKLKTEGDSEPITGKLADVLVAADVAAKIALNTIKVGSTNTEVTNAIAKVAENYGVTPIQGVLMHQMKRFVIDGNKVVIQKNEVDQEVDEIKFEPNEVYAVDIAFSTGDGKPKEKDAKTTVYKRAVEQNYRLKMKASRYLFNEINKKYPSLPFSITSFDDLRQAKMGTVECTKHDLLHTYPVLYEKEGDFVAHVKFTVFVMEKKTSQVTQGPRAILDLCKRGGIVFWKNKKMNINNYC